jgi:rare lipoprotein A
MSIPTKQTMSPMSKKIKTGLLAYILFPVAVLGREERPVRDTVLPKHHHKPASVKVQYGIASYYANKFEGRKTYTDEIFSQQKLTAASNTLPMQTWIRVTNLRNHKSVVVRINDKMHPRNKRLIDMSHAAAERLGYLGKGLTHVRVDVLGKKKPPEAEEGEATTKK